MNPSAAVNASVAFAFDPSYYPAPALPPAPAIDPAHQIVPEQAKPTPVAPVIDPEAQKLQRIREQAKQLVVQTITLGGGPNNQPMAIVNQQLLTIGQEILGFEITAIRAREVEFVKEGVPAVSKMSDGQ